MKPISELGGRELDAAVAEEVMGLRLDEECDGDSQEISSHEYGCSKCGFTRDVHTGDLHDPVPPAYSSSWDAARGVVEKVNQDAIGNSWEFCQVWKDGAMSHGNDWKAFICDGIGCALGREIAPTLPEAICRAALAWARRKAGK